MIDVAIISAPRKAETLSQSYRSAIDAGFKDIKVFGEPGTIPVGLFHENEVRYGAFKNFHQALSYLVECGESPYVVILSDDIVYCKNAYAIVLKALEEHADKPLGYYGLFTSGHDADYVGVTEGWNETKAGWDCWGGLFIMKKDVAKRMIQQPFYQNHLKNYKANQQIDACVSETLKRMGLPMYIHSPSLAQHIGQSSTLGHYHNESTSGYKFNPEL